jgi:maltose O-acetyltransferase
LSYFKFLSNKIKGYSFLTLIRLEFESLVFGLFANIPTTFGVLLRGIACKLFIKKINGFAWIQPRCMLIHTERMRVGSNFSVNSGSYINAIGGIEIGNYVLIGSNVTISSGVHPIEGAEPPVFARPTVPLKITIEDDVWIGAGVVIVPGVTLAKGTVIGANSVVTKSTEAYGVYVGAPAKKIRSRLSEEK